MRPSDDSPCTLCMGCYVGCYCYPPPSVSLLSSRPPTPPPGPQYSVSVLLGARSRDRGDDGIPSSMYKVTSLYEVAVLSPCILSPPPAPLALSPRPLREDGLLLLLHTHSPKSSLIPPPSLLPSWESSRPARQVRASSIESAKDLT